MPSARIVPSILEIGQPAWDALFPGAIENFAYLAAVESAGLPGFRWRYAVVEDGGDVIAAMPGFLTEYRLDTTLTGAGKRAAAAVQRVAPKLLTLRLACAGSPCTESAAIGIHENAGPDEQRALITALMDGFEQEARRERCALRAVKDILASAPAQWPEVLRSLGYRPTPGLPIAALEIDFPDIETYLAHLSPGTRKDMRRKLRAQDGVSIEVTTDVAPVIGDIMRLYGDTRRRAEMQFEDLTATFFEEVAANMAGRAFYVLYRAKGQLLAFNLLLTDDTVLLDKYFCMDAERGRRYNLYFLSWFTNLRICLERGLRSYQSGQAAYRNKVRLGSTLTATAMYFRHRNMLINSVLQRVAPYFAIDPAADLAA